MLSNIMAKVESDELYWYHFAAIVAPYIQSAQVWSDKLHV